METIWIPESEFKAYIWDAGDRATLENIEMKNRWVIEDKQGVRRIILPKPNE